MRAEIGDIEFPDIVQFGSDFEPNGIPKGSIMVPIGRGFKGNQSRTATIHEAITKLTVHLPAKVFLTVTPIGSSPGDAEDWPADEFVVFDGFAVGTGYQRSTSGANFVIYLLHWLSDLHYSSSVSATSHPLNPGDLAYDAAHLNKSTKIAIAGPNWVTRSGSRGIVTSPNVGEDLWGKVLKPWLVSIASEDRINKDQLPAAEVGGRDLKTNSAALNALNRIQPGAGGDGEACHVKSALEPKGINESILKDSILAALLQETFDSFAQTTLWGKLVGQYAPAFFLSLIPRVNDALVVPFTPGLRSTFKTITASQYNSANIAATMPRVPRAVGIFHSFKMWAGTNLGFDSVKKAEGSATPQSPTKVRGLAGWFEPTVKQGGDEFSASPDGLVILKETPRWLADDVLAWRFPRKSTGADKKKPIGTSGTPGVGDKEGDDGEPKVSETHGSFTPILDAFAQQWFIIEMLKGRSGELAGKLRFDIAPMSTVQIDTAREQFVASDQLATPMFGTVLRVSHQISSEAQRAGTAFTIAHIRNQAENEAERTSIEGPPLYKEPFVGCSLIDGF